MNRRDDIAAASAFHAGRLHVLASDLSKHLAEIGELADGKGGAVAEWARDAAALWGDRAEHLARLCRVGLSSERQSEAGGCQFPSSLSGRV